MPKLKTQQKLATPGAFWEMRSEAEDAFHCAKKDAGGGGEVLRPRPCTSSQGPSGTRPQSAHPTCMRMLWSCSPSTWNPAARSAWLTGCKVQLAFAVFRAVGAQAVQMVPEVLLTVISASLKLR